MFRHDTSRYKVKGSSKSHAQYCTGVWTRRKESRQRKMLDCAFWSSQKRVSVQKVVPVHRQRPGSKVRRNLAVAEVRIEPDHLHLYVRFADGQAWLPVRRGGTIVLHRFPREGGFEELP